MILLLFAAQAASTAACADGRPVQGQDWTCPRSIYFDSGVVTEVRPEWNGVLDEVAVSLRQGGGRVRLDSFSDRAGPRSSNRAVSAKRSETIRRALIHRGVSGSAIASVVHGEDGLPVPTPDGVREPQNRRVEITLLP